MGRLAKRLRKNPIFSSFFPPASPRVVSQAQRIAQPIDAGFHQSDRGKTRHLQTRTDPLAAVWECELMPMLERLPPPRPQPGGGRGHGRGNAKVAAPAPDRQNRPRPEGAVLPGA
jgi:hypothetical protein